MTQVAASAEADSESEPASRARSSFSRHRYLPAVVLLCLMAFSVVAHLGALKQDLPLPGGDETFFVKPAVSIAASGDLNPHWFGHPGSTVIYPVAALIHVWDALAHGGPVLGPHAELEQRFAADPTPFYLIARLWTIALAVAAIPVLFALGRRAFNSRVGLIASALWAVLPVVIHYGRIVRTETAATLFVLVTLYFCVRAWEEPERRRWLVCAGLSLGLAVSSRYLMATLAPCLLGAAVIPRRNDRRRAVAAAGIAAAASVIGFVLSTPYAVLDMSTVRHDLNAEATVSHQVASGLSPVGNLLWYLRDAIPGVLTWPLYIVALVGLALTIAGRRGRQLLLVAFCGFFLIGISASKLHWERWVIEMLPVLVMFAAVAVDRVAGLLAGHVANRDRARLVAVAAITIALAITPLLRLPKTNSDDAAASTAKRARDWMEENLPAGSRVDQLPATIGIPPPSIPPMGHGIAIDYKLDATKSLLDYRRAGVGYIVTNAGNYYSYALNARRYPREAAFYRELACKTRLVAEFKRSNPRFGPEISIYRLDQTPIALQGFFCDQPGAARS